MFNSKLLHCIFFLKVVLHNTFIEFKNGNAHYELEKGLIIINFKGIKVLVECNEMGYYIDVLVCSSLSHSETLEIVNDDILKTIYQYCASNNGCQGVWLVENIIRLECVQELTLLKYRYDYTTFEKEFGENLTKFKNQYTSFITYKTNLMNAYFMIVIMMFII